MKLSVRIHCGDDLFTEIFRQRLEGSVALHENGTFDLLVDKPRGWVMLEHPNLEFERCVILSDNRCPTYQLDLLDKQPAALIHGGDWNALLAVLETAQTGKAFYPKVTTPLTPAERETLRLVAFGYANADIAEKRGVTERTVKNSLVEVYRKLNLHSRVEATHYYLGHWHLIRNWQKPPFMN